jgi:hypothetical protein
LILKEDETVTICTDCTVTPRQVAAGRFRRPVLVLGIDGAYVPSRPESARGRREAKGFRFYLLDGERIVQVLSWHQVQTEDDVAEALQQVKEAGLVVFQKWRSIAINATLDLR